MKRWKIVGINFDHQHMGDLLRYVLEHPHADIVGVAHEDRTRMQPTIDTLDIDEAGVFTDYKNLPRDHRARHRRPLAPATGGHADWTEKVAPYGVHVLMEKPFAASVADAERMIAALDKTGQTTRHQLAPALVSASRDE